MLKDTFHILKVVCPISFFSDGVTTPKLHLLATILQAFGSLGGLMCRTGIQGAVYLFRR